MFEKFTEKALNVVVVAQHEALSMRHKEVCPEHLLLGLFAQKASISSKLLSFSGIRKEHLFNLICEKLQNDQPKNESNSQINFSDELTLVLEKVFDIAKELNNSYILTEHIFLSVLRFPHSKVSEILEELGFDIKRNSLTICKFLDKKKKFDGTDYHPENVRSADFQIINSSFDFAELSKSPVIEKAAAKLSTTNYEILGTEQILQSILEDLSDNPTLSAILENVGLNIQSFNEKLNEIKNRNDEFEGKQIIYTPNALKTMNIACDTAKELGAVNIASEHILLGLLKSQQGIAYKIIKSMGISPTELCEKIIRPIEKQMPEAHTILKLAKQETQRLGKNIVGSEMILLGILGEGAGIGARVLTELGVTIKDVRLQIEKIVGFGNAYSESSQVSFTHRARTIIEKAWEFAKKNNQEKIKSEHLLEAITIVTNSLAMRVLTNVGTDVLEIKQGILNLLNDDSTN